MSGEITSRQNPWFKRIRSALREHRHEIVMEGPKAVQDALRAGWKPLAVMQRASEQDRTLPNGFLLSDSLFDSLAETRSPQNVLALFERPRFTLQTVLDAARSGNSVIVALDGVQDPGNVGTIVRLAAAFDCAGVALLAGCADAYGPKAMRASAGAVLSVPVVSGVASALIGSGLPFYAADTRGGQSRIPAGPAIIAFGSEGEGLSDEIRSAAAPISIAMSERVESLNVAAAAAIVLSRIYEADP